MWKRELQHLAGAPNVTIKISGLGMCDPKWTVESIRPWVMTCIEAFGVERSFFGTNWPVDRLYSSYPDVRERIRRRSSGASRAPSRRRSSSPTRSGSSGSSDPRQVQGSSMPDARYALVTGAGSGIGQATAALLLERGHSVLATDLREESLEPVRRSGARIGRRGPVLGGGSGDRAGCPRP